MSSPSLPVTIRSANVEDSGAIPSSYTPSFGTPDLRALRAQYAGTPPPPNIPLRATQTPVSNRIGSPAAPLAPHSDSQPRRPAPQAVSGLSASRQPLGTGSDTPPVFDLDDLPDEEKAKVLGRHLVAKDLRSKALLEAKSATGSDLGTLNGSKPGSSRSRRSSAGGTKTPMRGDSEPFPIPYDAPGADVT
jgi:proton-coupled amino acid transporter